MIYKFRSLTEQEIVTLLADLPDWKAADDSLTASFTFPSFQNAMEFINRVARESEIQNHHPCWTNNFRKVDFRLSTYDAGNKITDLDFKLARFISQAAGSKSI